MDMPRPTVDIETVKQVNELIDEHTKVPAHQLNFQAKVEALVKIIDEQEHRIDKLKRHR